MNLLIRGLGHKAAKSAEKAGWINVGLGMQMLRDRNVRVSTKLAALGIGLGLTGLLEMAEVPLEAVVATLMPVVGIALDVIADGLEFAILPVLFAAILLPHLVKRRMVPVPQRSSGRPRR